MAMGFHGYLKNLQKPEIFSYLKQQHEIQSIGFFLGAAASSIGTCDENLQKSLRMHIHQQSNSDLIIDINVQCAALIAIGLLFLQHDQRPMTEFLVSQIGKSRTATDKIIGRECLSLCAGFSLGLVNLGSGSDITGMVDLKLDERLLRYINGGKVMDDPPSM